MASKIKHTFPIIQDVPYGFTDFNGNTWRDSEVDGMNSYNRDINKSANVAMTSDSLTWRERNFFLDQRHKYMALVMEEYRNPTAPRPLFDPNNSKFDYLRQWRNPKRNKTNK